MEGPSWDRWEKLRFERSAGGPERGVQHQQRARAQDVGVRPRAGGDPSGGHGYGQKPLGQGQDATYQGGDGEWGMADGDG